MSAGSQAAGAEFVGPLAHLGAVVGATARSYLRRTNAYLIDVIRWPLGALIMFATWRLAYEVSGRGSVGGADAAGFLLVGTFGLITWTATIWSSGYAIEYERAEGTIAALFLSPASRVATIVGYGLGGFVWLLPALALVAALGVATGARLHVADPLALAAAGLVLPVTSLATGFALAGLFILSRRANLLANFLQLPGTLLSGFLVPRESLPGWLRPLSDALPAGHAVDALRASALGAATLAETRGALGAAMALSGLYATIGFLALRRVEDAAKRSGQLDLY